MTEIGRRILIGAVITVVVIVAAVAVSSSGDGGDDASRTATSSTTSGTPGSAPETTSPSSPTAPATTRGPRGNGNSVTFAFAGDVNFPEVWDTEDGPPPNAPPLAEQVLADPKHVLDPIAPILSDGRPHHGQRRDGDHRRR